MKIYDDFEDAFVGFAQRCGQPRLAVYDRHICVAILVEEHGMDIQEAMEYFEFNVDGSWVGNDTPLIFNKMSYKDYVELGYDCKGYANDNKKIKK
tara:strand:+ start:929 stop:1213 length:285 start_codon:yes stop_codon:yes gene_type:complete